MTIVSLITRRIYVVTIIVLLFGCIYSLKIVNRPTFRRDKVTICHLTPLTRGISMLNPMIAGGFLSGGLHAVTGPDHLAALLPPSVGRSGWFGMKIGAAWGLGHGVSATILGILGYCLKGQISHNFRFFSRLTRLAESIVGISLIGIGLIGIKENLVPDLSNESSAMAVISSSKAIFINGFLHGFSWDGAPSLAPAVAMTTWTALLSFLLSYCMGTTVAMSFVAGAVGEGSSRIGSIVNKKNFSRNLSLASSGIAIIVGVVWILQSTFFH